jgi:hypothetical protein
MRRLDMVQSMIYRATLAPSVQIENASIQGRTIFSGTSYLSASAGLLVNDHYRHVRAQHPDKGSDDPQLRSVFS